eukprot:m.222744 g.222744  ORF g.222744 m.222744 type:complete len:356 (+) comp10814_c0_seq40:312-1379(+)
MSDKPQIIEHASKSLGFTLFAAKWVPSSARFVVLGQHARGTGALHVYELERGQLVEVTKTEKPQAFKCCTFGASALEERHLATGDFAGNLMVWDLERTEMPIYAAKAHSQIINAIDGVGGLGIGGGAPEIVTGGRDGAVRIWDTRQRDDPVADISPDDAAQARDCWAVAFGNSFNDDERCVAAGYDNGDLKMFDLRMMKAIWETNLDNGICSLQFDRKDINMNKLLSVGLESAINVFDLRTFHEEHGFASVKEKAHKATIWCGQHLPQNRDVFMTAGGNGSVSLWKYSYPAERSVMAADNKPRGVAGSLQLLNNVAISSQPITAFDWHPDKLGLAVSTSVDETVRVCIATNLNLL